MMRRRVTTVALATLASLLLLTGSALAHYCTNVSKKAGAGTVGVLFIDFDTDEVVPDLTTVAMNKRGQITGGFFDIHVDVDGDREADLFFYDVYAHAALPTTALLAAGCDQAVETQLPFLEEVCPPSVD